VRALALVELMEDPLLHDKVHYAFGEVHRPAAAVPAGPLQAYRSALAHAQARRGAGRAGRGPLRRIGGRARGHPGGRARARQQWRKALELFEELAAARKPIRWRGADRAGPAPRDSA